MEKKKVVIGMSGGVDSSVAAYLLKKQGYDVAGVTMETWHGENGEGISGAINDARRVADQLGVPYYVLDFKEEFKKNVIDYFVSEYAEGRTPNPCVVCNRFVKWEALLNRGRQIGAEYIATGHYARIVQLENGRYTLQEAATGMKDQTYALYNLTQDQLAHTIMPVGAYSKDEIRAMAEDLGLTVASKPDSQDICFIPDGDYAAFIKRENGEGFEEGNFVLRDGTVVGRHKGIVHYTVGQRKGLGLSLGRPVFVLEIRRDTNEVVVGDNEDSMCTKVFAHKLNLMSVARIEEPKRVWAKIRYNHKGAWCTVTQTAEDEVMCIFDEPVRAVTPGQALVLYDNHCVLGGGIITKGEK